MKKITNIVKKDIDQEVSSFEQLSAKHRLFVKAYIQNMGNASKSYKEVYPHTSLETARANSSRLLSYANIIQAIDEEFGRIWHAKDLIIEKSKTWKLIHSVATTSIDQIIDIKNGTLTVKDFKDIPESALHAIKNIRCIEKQTANGVDRVIEIQMHDKLRALEIRARMQGLFDLKDDSQNIIINIIPAKRPEILEQ